LLSRQQPSKSKCPSEPSSQQKIQSVVRHDKGSSYDRRTGCNFVHSVIAAAGRAGEYSLPHVSSYLLPQPPIILVLALKGMQVAS